jgi:hypothetical protein
MGLTGEPAPSRSFFCGPAGPGPVPLTDKAHRDCYAVELTLAAEAATLADGSVHWKE